MSIRPNRAHLFWKHRSQRINRAVKAGEIRLDYRAGGQNRGIIPDVNFDPASEDVQVFSVDEYPDGKRQPLRWICLGSKVQLDDAGGIDSLVDTITVTKPAQASFFNVGDVVQAGGEIMTVTSITPNVPDAQHDSWEVRRGDHGTDAVAHVQLEPIHRIVPTVSMKTITLTGVLTGLPAPSNLIARPVLNAIELVFDHNLTATQIDEQFQSFVLYFDKSTIPNFDPEVDPVPPGVSEVRPVEMEIGDDTVRTLFAQRDVAGLLDEDLFFFRVATEDLSGTKSQLSNEANSAIGDSTEPLPGGPPAPDVTLVLDGKLRVRADARRLTQTDPGAAFANIKEAEIEIYQGSSPSTADTPGDTLLINQPDGRDPYQLIFSVAGTGAGDYWARARFKDALGVPSPWGLSAVLAVAAEDTTDTQPTPVAQVRFDQDVLDVLPDGRNDVLIGVAPIVGQQSDSWDMSQLQIRQLQAGGFDPSTGFTAGSPTIWTSVAKPLSEDPGSATLGLFSILLRNDTRWEATGRVHNAHGWSDFITPVELVLETVARTGEDDAPTIDELAVYTVDTQPAGGDPNLRGNQIRVDVKLGPDNSSTFGLTIQAHKSLPFPTETQRLSQATATATVLRGTSQVDISGHSATAGEFVGKWLRLGKRFGSNLVGGKLEGVEERKIVSHTTGDPFSITVEGAIGLRNTGQMNNWEIVDDLEQHLVDFRKDFSIDTTGSHGNFEGFVELPAYVEMPVGTYFFRSKAQNVFGKGANGSVSEFIYADNTTSGTLTEGAATSKTVPGVVSGDIAEEAVTQSKVSKGLKAIGLDGVEFSADDNDSISWNSGSLLFHDGSSETVNSGTRNLDTNNQPEWIYKISGNPTLQFTNGSVLNALGDDRWLIGIAVPTPNADEFATVFTQFGTGGSVITAAVMVVQKLSALSVDVGELTAGILTGLLFRSAVSGQRTEHDSTSFRAIDSAGLVRFEVMGDEIILRAGVDDSTSGALSFKDGITLEGKLEVLNNGRMLFGSAAEIFQFSDENLNGRLFKVQIGSTVTLETDDPSLPSNPMSFRYQTQDGGAGAPNSEHIFALGGTDYFKVSKRAAKLAADVAEPAAESGWIAQYGFNNGGSIELRARFPNGTVKTVATDV